MAQLKMYWLKGTPIKEMSLPDGYSISVNKADETDMLAWLECCRNGLIGDEDDFDTYNDRIKFRRDCKETEDVFFLDYEGRHIATTVSYTHLTLPTMAVV